MMALLDTYQLPVKPYHIYVHLVMMLMFVGSTDGRSSTAGRQG